MGLGSDIVSGQALLGLLVRRTYGYYAPRLAKPVVIKTWDRFSVEPIAHCYDERTML